MSSNAIRRLARLEAELPASAVEDGPTESWSINEELNRWNPWRHARYIMAMYRTGLLAEPPDPDDRSPLAQQMRDAWTYYWAPLLHKGCTVEILEEVMIKQFGPEEPRTVATQRFSASSEN